MKVNSNNFFNKNAYYDSIVSNDNNGHVLTKDKHKNADKYNTIRPTQAVSFGGSAVSLGQKALGGAAQSVQNKIPAFFQPVLNVARKVCDKTGQFVQNRKAINKLADVVADNEVLYTALFSLIVAGGLKPMWIIKRKGSAEEKDKQYIATKNFLQAAIGCLLTLTIGAGIVKKSYASMKNNMSLILLNPDKTLKMAEVDSSKAMKIAKEKLICDNSGLAAKFNNAKKAFKENEGISKLTGFVSGMVKKPEKYQPTREEILAKSQEIIDNIRQHHLKIFEKDTEFIAKLKDAGTKTLEQINEEAEKIAQETGQKPKKIHCTLNDAFESLWKNSTGWITTIMKAKISSWLLPTVTAFLFAKKQESVLKDKVESFNDFANKTNPKNQPSFKGKVADKSVDLLTRGIENLAMSKPGQGFANALSSFVKKPSAAMAQIESILLTAYWTLSTGFSKKIAPDQKLGLNTHTVLVTAVSGVASYVVDTLFDPIVNSAKTSYKDKLTNVTSELLQSAKDGKIENMEEALKQGTKGMFNTKGIMQELLTDGKLLEGADLQNAIKTLSGKYGKIASKLKSLTVFTLVVRLLVPVFMLNTSAEIKKFIKKKREEKRAKAAE